jgi:hypothetical protein
VSLLGVSLQQTPLWVLQSVAAFPLRDEPAPAVVYAAYFVVAMIMMAVALWWSDRRGRIALSFVALASLAVPFMITYFTVAQTGTIWQGRYTLPFSAGLLVMAGVAVEDGARQSRWTGPMCLAGGLALATAHVVSVVSVFVKEAHNPVTTSARLWPLAPVSVVALTAASGLALWALTMFTPRTRTAEDELAPRVGGRLTPEDAPIGQTDESTGAGRRPT